MSEGGDLLGNAGQLLLAGSTVGHLIVRARKQAGGIDSIFLDRVPCGMSEGGDLLGNAGQLLLADSTVGHLVVRAICRTGNTNFVFYHHVAGSMTQFIHNIRGLTGLTYATAVRGISLCSTRRRRYLNDVLVILLRANGLTANVTNVVIVLVGMIQCRHDLGHSVEFRLTNSTIKNLVIRTVVATIGSYLVFLHDLTLGVIKRGNNCGFSAELRITFRTVYDVVIGAVGRTVGGNLVLLYGLTLGVIKRGNNCGFSAELRITFRTVYDVVIGAVGRTIGRNLVFLYGLTLGVTESGHHLLNLEHLLTYRAMRAFGQAIRRTGGFHGLVGHLSMSLDCDRLLLNQHLTADGAMLALGQTGLGTSGFHGLVNHLSVAERGNRNRFTAQLLVTGQAIDYLVIASILGTGGILDVLLGGERLVLVIILTCPADHDGRQAGDRKGQLIPRHGYRIRCLKGTDCLIKRISHEHVHDVEFVFGRVYVRRNLHCHFKLTIRGEMLLIGLDPVSVLILKLELYVVKLRAGNTLVIGLGFVQLVVQCLLQSIIKLFFISVLILQINRNMILKHKFVLLNLIPIHRANMANRTISRGIVAVLGISDTLNDERMVVPRDQFSLQDRHTASRATRTLRHPRTGTGSGNHGEQYLIVPQSGNRSLCNQDVTAIRTVLPFGQARGLTGWRNGGIYHPGVSRGHQYHGACFPADTRQGTIAIGRTSGGLHISVIHGNRVGMLTGNHRNGRVADFLLTYGAGFDAFVGACLGAGQTIIHVIRIGYVPLRGNHGLRNQHRAATGAMRPLGLTGLGTSRIFGCIRHDLMAERSDVFAMHNHLFAMRATRPIRPTVIRTGSGNAFDYLIALTARCQNDLLGNQNFAAGRTHLTHGSTNGGAGRFHGMQRHFHVSGSILQRFRLDMVACIAHKAAVTRRCARRFFPHDLDAAVLAGSGASGFATELLMTNLAGNDLYVRARFRT